MPTNLQCRLAIASNGLPNVASVGSYAAAISAHLLQGSHGDIVLNCAGPMMVPNPSAPGAQSYPIDLHNDLLWINQNPQNVPIQNVCVLYAHNYLGLSNIFGIMFDRGFTTQDDPNSAPIYLARPRQGCAVFLGSIASYRAANECATEALFTTIHELGHVFNLQHDETVPNFLHSSASNQCYPQNYYQFTPVEQNQLSVCSSNSSVMPGGSIFGSGNATNLPPRGKGRRAAPITISLSVSQAEFWQFEPVQLEILIAPSGARQATEIPQRIDPGAEGFDIMIENEAGERHLYRSPIISCGLPGSLQIAAGKLYRRDLPIFGQAGGYTFRNSGRHRIWAELAWSGGRARSNILEVDVRREIGLTPTEEKYRAVMKDESVGSLLFHRRDTIAGHGIVRLKRYLELENAADGRGELSYALARAIIGRRRRKALAVREHRALERLVEHSLRDGSRTSFQIGRREALLSDLVSA